MTAPETLLELDADPTSLRLVRLVAATLADSVGLDFEDVEDVRLAVDELCAATIRASAPDARLRVTFAARDQELEVEGLSAGDPNGAPPVLDSLSAEIVAAVTAGHTLVQLDGVNRFHFIKRHETDPA